MNCQLCSLKIIFFDEISVVGSMLFNVQVNNRLKDIEGSKNDFGSVA
jgi:hypothetical protein